jgi:E3 ubiquitin-protein ligase MARCH6
MADCVLARMVCPLDLLVLVLDDGHHVHVRHPFTRCPRHILIGSRNELAVALGGCREIMRPGAFWFIQDPQERDVHPIRDILERPALAHAEKLASSTKMYAAAIGLAAGVIGGVVRSIPTLTPFRWQPT